MRQNFKKLMLFFTCFFTPAAFSAWMPYMKIESNYFEGSGNNHRIVLTLDSDFHSCGWNRALNIHLSTVGEQAFQSYTSTVLAAILTNRKISVNMDQCAGDRANVVAIRLAMQ